MKMISKVLICIFILALSGCDLNTKQEQPKLSAGESKPNVETSSTIFTDITLQQLEEKISSDETFYVVMTTTYCRYCAAFKTLFEQNKNLQETKAYQVVLDKEKTSEEENLEIIHMYMPDFETTPGLARFEKGEMTGYTDFMNSGLNDEILEQWFASNPLHKE